MSVEHLEIQVYELQKELNSTNTSHILHAIMTLLTGGFWAIIWIVCYLIDDSKRNKLERQIDALNLRIIVNGRNNSVDTK